MRTIAILNQKGGVGKTTTSVNLAHALALQGKRVLLLDFDPQGHLGSYLGCEYTEGMDQVLLNDMPLQAVQKLIRDNLYLVPAGESLGLLETTGKGVSRGYRLQKALDNMQERFDFIIIDCPPATGLLAMNVLLAVDELLIPVTGDYLALTGLSRLMQVIMHIETRLERKTKKWFVLTRFNERRKLAREIQKKLHDYFPNQVLPTTIRESVTLAESPGFAQTIFEYRNKSYGADDYRNLAINLMALK